MFNLLIFPFIFKIFDNHMKYIQPGNILPITLNNATIPVAELLGLFSMCLFIDIVFSTLFGYKQPGLKIKP